MWFSLNTYLLSAKHPAIISLNIHLNFFLSRFYKGFIIMHSNKDLFCGLSWAIFLISNRFFFFFYHLGTHAMRHATRVCVCLSPRGIHPIHIENSISNIFAGSDHPSHSISFSSFHSFNRFITYQIKIIYAQHTCIYFLISQNIKWNN